MPHYEFFCNTCNKTFPKILTIAQHDADMTACPYCGSHAVEQCWSAFSVVTLKEERLTLAARGGAYQLLIFA